MASRLILVGYDGSNDSNAALDWAIAEGLAQGKAVQALFVAPDLAAMEAATASVGGMTLSPDLLVPDGSSVLKGAIERAAGTGIELTTDTSTGAPARVLVERSEDADLLVIGARGLGAAASVLLGSAVVHVSAHAKCPVVVARASSVPDGPVVVGYDGSKAAEPALAWAVQHATANKAPLEVITISRLPTVAATVPYTPSGKTRTGEDPAIAAIRTALKKHQTGDDELKVTINVVDGRPSTVLVDASARARETVVGTRGRGAFAGMLLGSTSQALLHHGKGTIVVVPEFHG